MADTVSGGSPAGPPKKELSMELRLLLAFLLMGAVMFLSPYLFKSTAPPPPAKKTETAQQQKAPAAQTQQPAATATAAGNAQPAPAGTTYAPTPERVLPPRVIENGLFRVTFSNQGATVRTWQLTNYKGNDNKPLELTNTTAGMAYPFSFYIPGNDELARRLNWAHYAETVSPDGLSVTYEFSDGQARARKVFRFRKNSHISHVEATVEVGGKPVPSMIAWRGGFGDMTIANPGGNERSVYFDVQANKLVEQNVGNAKNGPVSSTGQYSFAGLADNYFAAVFLPANGGAVQQTTFAHTVRTPVQEKPTQLIGVAVSNGSENRFELFVGPKDVDLLRRVNPKLEQLVDFGWFGFLAKPLFLITNWLNNAFVQNYGWSIVIVTVALNFLLFPLKLSNMKSMKKMQALKPQIDAIGQRYKNVGIRDPRKAEQNQEVMALYKANGVNPMGGCFPMLIQIPFFFAFYKVFTVAVEMRGASWLWVNDLSQAEQLPIKILPLLMIASQFYMQKMTPQTTMDPNQQRMMLFMPLIFGFMFYNFPSGLVLYYLTSNLVSMGQQWFFNRTALADAAARSVEQPKRRIGRK